MVSSFDLDARAKDRPNFESASTLLFTGDLETWSAVDLQELTTELIGSPSQYPTYFSVGDDVVTIGIQSAVGVDIDDPHRLAN